MGSLARAQGRRPGASTGGNRMTTSAIVRRGRVAALVAAVLASTFGAVGPLQAAGNPDKPGYFTCSSSPLRLTFQGPLAPLGTVEPFAANPEAGAHCQTAEDALLSEQIGPVTVTALQATTEAQKRGSEAAAQVLHVAVGPVEITLLRSFAEAQCQNNAAGRPTARRPVLGGGAEVASIKVNGQEVVPAAVNEPRVVGVPGVATVTIIDEETSTTTGRNRGGETTHQALLIETGVANLVLAEARADYHGQPCAPGQTK